jgi:serine/threonine protein phosphatase PrpC
VAISYTTAIGSHVGMVRSNNQDSAFAGNRLFLVADGMGGHAGGDVASALTTQALAEVDELDFTDPKAATDTLRSRLLAANTQLSETVYDRPELSGLGTTFTGIFTLGNQLALAHIGDSRLYLLRGGKLTQITKDHTFVQRLVDSGRITEDEAKTHPRRSVLMRVLGDVDSSPEIDTSVLDTRAGDLWLLCSDGLCGYVEDDEIELILRRRANLQGAIDALIDKSLSRGAPDNVTVVLVEASAQPQPELGPRFAGSAASPVPSVVRKQTTVIKIPGWRRTGRRSQPVAESHFEPRVDEYLDELIAETKRRNRRRRALWLVSLGLAIAALAGGVLLGYQWTQTRYFVGTDGNTVIIYRGVQQNIGTLSLSSEAEDTGIPLDALGGYEQRQVARTLSAGSIDDARNIVLRLGVNAQ